MNTPKANLYLLSLDSPDATLGLVGGKGASLARLAAAGLPVPPGFHITTESYRRFVNENHLADAILSAADQAKGEDQVSLDLASVQIQSLFARGTVPDDIAGLLRAWYDTLGGSDTPVAVRSSATAEDLPDMSFAGQQETYLNVHGDEAVLEAVKRCWASLWTARALGYRNRQGIRNHEVSLAVIIQQLIPAEAAGILFTAHPLTGDRTRMVINAAWGLGEAIVSGLVTPDTFIINKQTGALELQEAADKEVMTIMAPQGTHQVPVPAGKRKRAVLEPSQVAELGRYGVQIESLYGQPMDIEWALVDEKISILQARPITTLPEPPVTLEWKTPRAKGSYWRSSVVELLPDPLSPLFATLGLPAWDAAMHSMWQSVGLSLADILPKHMLITINEYAYYDFGFRPSQVVRFLLLMPRLVRRLLPTALARWAKDARPRYAGIVGAWAVHDLKTTSAAQLLEGAREFVLAAAEHYLTMQSGILPVAAYSEWTFNWIYNHFVRRKGDPPALTFLLGFDSMPIQAEKSLYNLAMWASAKPELGDYLKESSGGMIAEAYQAAAVPITGEDAWKEFCCRFGEHLDRFGHVIYSLDFANNVPADDPAPLLETLRYFMTGEAPNPFVRQSTAETAREQATQVVLDRLKGQRLKWFTWLLQWTQSYAVAREDALADVGLAWPLLRRIFREIGRRLVTANAIDRPDDVFWLKLNEIETVVLSLDTGRPLPDFHAVVVERKLTWERERKVTPPVVLPVKGGGRFMGMDWSRWMPARSHQAAGNSIKGIGASPGLVTGVARVIHDPSEFSQMLPGNILVAKITTPAWTPLFSLAAGVVTDVGGPLSHSSIVAREYHIPAVLGTGVATERLHSGQLITVDGDSGVVIFRYT